MSEYRSLGKVEEVRDGKVYLESGRTLTTFLFEDCPSPGDNIYERREVGHEGPEIVQSGSCNGCGASLVPGDSCFICPCCNRKHEEPKSEERKHEERLWEELEEGPQTFWGFLKRLLGLD